MGIGGRDSFIINLEEGDGHQGHWHRPLMIAPGKDGITFFYNSESNKSGRSFVVPVAHFNSLVEWLKSWGYI